MSFWSKLGHGLLKIAPIAAGFIPGVGPLASMAIGGLTSAIDKKTSGGSWMDALRSGGIGAATGFAGAKIPKGIGPSKGFWGTAGNVAKQTGRTVLNNVANSGGRSSYPMDERYGVNQGSSGSNWQDMLGNITRNRGQNQNQGDYSYGRGEETAVSRGGNGMSSFGRRMQRQLGPVMGQEDQSNPNLAMSLGAGRMDAMRSQPFRGGYDINTQPTDDEGNDSGDPTSSRMPPIYPTGRRRQQVYY